MLTVMLGSRAQTRVTGGGIYFTENKTVNGFLLEKFACSEDIVNVLFFMK